MSGPVSKLSELPSILAIPFGQYFTERHPEMKLHRLCDAAEVATRFCTIVLLGELRHQIGDEPFPERLLKVFQPQIERPTFGQWKNMLGELLAKRDLPARVTPALRAFVSSHLMPGLTGGEKGAQFGLIRLRNMIHHGGALPPRESNALLEYWSPWLERLIAEMAFFNKTRLCWAGRGSTRLLAGPDSAAGLPTPAPASMPHDLENHVVLVEGENWVDLWPLCDYGRARVLSFQGNRQASVEGPLVYLRAEAAHVLYAALGVDLPQSENPDAVEEFRRLFKLDERVRSDEPDFELEIAADAAAFIGREDDLCRLKEAVAAAREGVLWVTGSGGMGKTFLMARLAQDLGGDDPTLWRVAWRFKVSDQHRCHRVAFLRHAVGRLAQFLDRRRPSLTGNASELQEQLRALLREAGRLAERRVLFVMDGLDEIERLDPSFPQLLFQLAMPSTVWLCAGRPERSLRETFSADRCKHVFPDGLPGMSRNDIRAMLLDGTGSLKYELLELEAEIEGRGSRSERAKAAVEAIAERARDLPLYVHFLVQDIQSGHFRFRQLATQLPDGLNAYYEDLLRRLEIGEQHGLATPLLVGIAWARAPLEEEALLQLMVLRRALLHIDGARPTLRRGLEALRPMLRIAPRMDGRAGYELYHPTFRDYIQEDPRGTIGVQNPLARLALAEMALGWSSLGAQTPEQEYAVLFGPTHLLEAAGHGDDGESRGRLLSEAERLLEDEAFADTKVRRLQAPTSLSHDWTALVRARLAADPPSVTDVERWLDTASAPRIDGALTGLLSAPWSSPVLAEAAEQLLKRDGDGPRQAALALAAHSGRFDLLLGSSVLHTPHLLSAAAAALFKELEPDGKHDLSKLGEIFGQLSFLRPFRSKRIFELLVSVSLAILGRQARNAPLLRKLGAQWNCSIRRLLRLGDNGSSGKRASPLVRLGISILVRMTTAIFASLPSYQSLNLRELRLTFDVPPAERRRSLPAIDLMRSDSIGLDGVVPLIAGNQPDHVYHHMTLIWALIIRGRRSPEEIVGLIRELWACANEHMRGSLLYVFFQTLHPVQNPPAEWLRAYGDLTLQYVRDGEGYFTTNGTKYQSSHLAAFAELVLDRASWEGQGIIGPLLGEALESQKRNYAGSLIEALRLLTVVHGRHRPVLRALHAVMDADLGHFETEVARLLGPLRYQYRDEVDEFLAHPRLGRLRNMVVEQTHPPSLLDAWAMMDQAIFAVIENSPAFRTFICDWGARGANLPSVERWLEELFVGLLEFRFQE